MERRPEHVARWKLNRVFTAFRCKFAGLREVVNAVVHIIAAVIDALRGSREGLALRFAVLTGRGTSHSTATRADCSGAASCTPACG